MNDVLDDADLAHALGRADAAHPPAPGLDWSPMALQAAVRQRQQRRLVQAGLVVTTLALLAVLLRASAPVDGDQLAVQAEVQQLQIELLALRTRLQPVVGPPRPDPTHRDRTAVRLELARAGAESCRAHSSPKEPR
ncbi:MAG: hypothetical protein JNL12_05930 [Planctomycetes bacterium]|nr:hypothetical protein [Planctomycetota bacterium]